MDRHDGMSRRRSGGAATSSSRRRARRFRCAVTLGSLAISALCLTLAAAADETGDALAAATAMPTARPFDGVHAVGALFRDVAGKLRHFCTAAVVRSRRGDLLITAAHCLDGKVSPGGDVASVRFAPGFHGRAFPYGTLAVTFEYVDSNWHRYHDPDDDFAFLVVGRNIEKSTGAERVATGQKMPQQVQVIGYPDSTDTPVTCLAPARNFYIRPYAQLIFRCGGYTDGTSGGPFLDHVSGKTATGDVVGVIGGYQEGGDYADISYSPRFLANVAALYKIAN